MRKLSQGPVLIAGFPTAAATTVYAVALYLKGMGREIRGSCAIDSFMIDSSGPSEGVKIWRALAEGIEHFAKIAASANSWISVTIEILARPASAGKR